MGVNRFQRVVSAGLTCAAIIALATDARALGPVDVEIAGEVGTGTNPIGGAMNPQILGVGGRAGVAFRHVYAGLDFLYDFSGYGDNGSVTFGGVKSYAFGARFGYGFAIEEDNLVVRPQVGIGDYVIPSPPIGFLPGEVFSPASGLYLEPGVCVLGVLGHLILGADANVLVLPDYNGFEPQAKTETALTAHLQAGVRF